MTLEQLWGLLQRVQALSFVARSANPTGWNGAGSGTVLVQRVSDQAITFTETGLWRSRDERENRFRNVFRWSAAAECLRLEHLRFGEDSPVYLFELAQVGEREWRSVSPHRCSEDCYAARLVVHDDGIVLRWSVHGPRKQEEIEATYSWAAMDGVP